MGVLFIVSPCLCARASYSSWYFCWPSPPRTPLYQVVIALSWVVPTLLSLMSASLTLIINHIAQSCLMSSQAEPFYISFVAWFPIFTGRGPSPECRYPTRVLALSIGMFHYLELVCLPLDNNLLLVCNYKALLFFFKIFKIFEKVQKKSKNQKVGQERMLSLEVVESCLLRTEHCISHPLVGLIVWL